jgi:hypothetical protein
MQRQARQPDQFNTAEANTPPGSLLRRLREDPQDAVNRIAGEIGPRPTTSLAEAQAAAYLDGRLRRAGLRVVADPFRSAAGVAGDGIMLALLATVAVILYYWFPLPSLFLAVWDLVIAIVAFSRPGAPLLARRRPSQNVIGTRAIAGTPHWRVVLLAPLDSPPARGKITQLLNTGTRPLIGRVIACGLLALFALLALSGPLEARRALWYAQMLPTAYLIVLAALDVWALRAAAPAGAVNHAGALATLLASAEELTALDQTELWIVALGATNTGAGIADLLRRYPFDREMTLFIGLEGIGAGNLSYVTREGIVPERPADPLLIQLAAAADVDDPIINVEPRPYTAEPTIVRPLLRAGQRALMIMGLDANGLTPYRGRRDDSVEVIDLGVLERAVRLVVGLVRKIDTA